MTYATSIAARSQKIRVLVKIAGVPGYLSTDDVGTYDDSAGGNTHGSAAVRPEIVDVSYSAGHLDYQRNMVTQSTMTMRVLDSDWLRGALAINSTPRQYLAAQMVAAETSAQVQDVAAYGTVSYLHIGRECVAYESDNSTDTFTVARSALGTTAEQHPQGTAVTLTPQHWRGRKAWLVLGSNDGSGWSYEDPFQAFRISATPRYVDGAWEFEFSDAMDFTDREFYAGFRDVTVSDFLISTDASNNTIVYLYVDDVAHFLESGDTDKQPLHVVLNGGTSQGCFVVDDVDVGNKRLNINISARNLFKKRHRMRNWIGEAFGETADNVMRHNVRHPLAGVTARPVYYIRDAADVPLRVMLSTYGAAADNYDLLPGSAPTNAEVEIRAGAGLTSDDVDVTTWAAAGEFSQPSAGYLVGAAGPISVAEFLSNDVCPAIGGYWRVSRAGKIQFKSYNPTTSATSSSYAITSANDIGGSVSYVADEEAIVSRVILWTEYDPETGDFRKKIVAHYGEQDHIYGKTAQEYEVKSRLAAVSGQSALAVAERYFARFGQAVVRLSVKCPFSACTVQPGDTVSVTSTLLPSPSSATLGQTSELYEVASSSLDMNTGTVRLELVSRPAAKLISPAALVVAADGGDLQCSLIYGNGALDTEFAIGWYVQAISDAGVLRAGTAEIVDLSELYIMIGSGITGVDAGDTIIFADYGTAVDTATATYSSADQTDFAFISDKTIDAAQAGDRWY